MNTPSPRRREQLWSWIKRRPFTALGALVLLVLAILCLRRRDSEWEQVYLPAAAHLQQGEDIYRIQGNYLYPPFMALAALPFLAVPPALSRLLWIALNGACLAAMCRWGWRLAGGGRLEGETAGTAGERWAALLGCLCGVSYIENCVAHQQTDIVIGAALIGGCLLLQRGRPLWAATTFGLAAACKCTALLWVPYLLWRRRPLAALWVLVVAIGANLLPDCVSPAPEGGSRLQEYAARYLKPLTTPNHYVGVWGSDPVYNQSFAGLTQRCCTTAWVWTANDCLVVPRPPLLGPKTLRLCVHGAELLLLAAVLSVCGQPFRRLSDGGSLQALECGMVLLLMLLLSPMSSKAHFGTLMLPGFCLARAALHARRRLLWIVTGGCVVLGLLCNKDPLGERLYTLSLWYGVVTLQTLLLLAGCLLVYRQQKRQLAGALPCPALLDGTAQRAA